MCQEYCLSDSILFVFFLAEMVNRLRKCEFCGQTFTNRSAYNRHKTKMHAKRFCRWCNHEEDRPYLLRDHIRRHHPHVNVNTTAEVLYRSADVPVERELFPTPARYSPYTPEEVEMPLTYIPTPKVAGTSFQPIAPRPQQTSTPVLLPLAVNSMAASSQQPPARKRTLERPRTVVVAHCHAKVGKQDPDKLEDCTAVSQLSPVSDWADDENGMVLEEPPKITVEQYLKRQKKMESSDADEPESDLANGLKPDALWYDMQASIRHVLETTEQKSAEEVWKEVAVAKRGPSSALGSQASSTVTSEEDLEEMMSMDGPQLTASEPEQPRPDPSLPDDPEALQKDDGEQGVFTRLHLSSITTTPCPVMTCPDGDVSSPGPQHIGTPLGELQNEVLDLSIASPTHVPVADASKANDKVVLPAVGTGEEPQSDALDLSVRRPSASAPVVANAELPHTETMRSRQPSSARKVPVRRVRVQNRTDFDVPRTWSDMMRPVTNVTFEAPDRDGYRRWQGNPALFFLGAPSEFAPHAQGRILQRLRHRAKLCQGYQGIRHRDLGIYMIRRDERAVLPNGTTYELSATWVENPDATIRKDRSTQTDGDNM